MATSSKLQIQYSIHDNCNTKVSTCLKTEGFWGFANLQKQYQAKSMLSVDIHQTSWLVESLLDPMLAAYTSSIL
jgi:hypothetical protein